MTRLTTARNHILTSTTAKIGHKEKVIMRRVTHYKNTPRDIFHWKVMTLILILILPLILLLDAKRGWR